jgi:alkaline phosphatase D
MRLLLLLTFAATALAQTPTVLLISLDGFRTDYAEKYHAKNLIAMRHEGASAELIPSFPSLTFPNHISLVTGMYPEHHGIVANTLYDPARQQEFSMSAASTDGTWYRAAPLWVLAEKQGIRSACMFWPASDAEIDGTRPWAWFKYDSAIPNQQRIEQILTWLKLPEAQRPHLLTLYFDDADEAGHKYGPDSPETAAAVQRLDEQLGALRKGIAETGVPVNIVIVADHGMQYAPDSIALDRLTDLTGVRAISGGPFVLLYSPNPETTNRIYRDLHGKSPKFEIYRRQNLPKHLHYSTDPRIGDLVVIAKAPIQLTVTEQHNPPNIGKHGFDPAHFPTMRAIFVAVGPNIRPGVTLGPVPNIDVMPFLATILHITLPQNLDGSAKPFRKAYQPTK